MRFKMANSHAEREEAALNEYIRSAREAAALDAAADVAADPDAPEEPSAAASAAVQYNTAAAMLDSPVQTLALGASLQVKVPGSAKVRVTGNKVLG